MSKAMPITIAAAVALMTPVSAFAGTDSPELLARQAASLRSEAKRDYAEIDRLLARLADPKLQAEVIRIGRSTHDPKRVAAYINTTLKPQSPIEVEYLNTDFCWKIAYLKTKWFTLKGWQVGTTCPKK